MDEEVELDKDLEIEMRGFYDRARQWYFGGYLKMQQAKIPDASELIQLLHVLGYVVREVEHPSCDNLKLQQEEISIEIKSKSPPFRVVMNSPITTSFAPGKYFSGNMKESEIDLKPVLDPLNLPNMPILCNVPEKKQIVAREIVQILIQYITDKKEGTLARPSYKFNREQQRKCLSMESINLASQQGIKLTKTNDGNVLAIKNMNSEVTVGEVKTGVTMIPLVVNVPSTATEYQEEAMEVDGDIPPSLVSNAVNSIFCSQLSPVGFSPIKDKTWVIETFKEKVLDISSLTKTSTPNPEMLENYRLNKIQRLKQMRSEHNPDRLRSPNKQDVHPISQTKRAREIALMYSKKVMIPQAQPQSKNSTSSSSSKSSTSSSLKLNQTKSVNNVTKSEALNSSKTEVTVSLEASGRRINNLQSFSNSKKGTCSTGDDQISNQKQNRIPTPKNKQRIHGSVTKSNEGTTSMATRTQSSLLPRSIIQPQVEKQSKPLKATKRNNLMNTKDEERAARQNRLELPTYSTRYGLRSKQP